MFLKYFIFVIRLSKQKLINIMSKSKLEYIWLDGYFPTQNMRSKTKIEDDFSGKLEDCPIWSFDG